MLLDYIIPHFAYAGQREKQNGFPPHPVNVLG